MTGLDDAVASVYWYHTIDLPGGIVTPGFFDLRGAVPHVPIPASLAGQRCLDVACSDGFWSFEMERRGALEVVAVDVDDPADTDWQSVDSPMRNVGKDRTLRAFSIASEALGSRVERHNLSLYDLSPEVVGKFDFVFVGSVLLHLRDPVRALEAIRSVVRGQLLSCDIIHLLLSVVSPFRPAGQLWHADNDARWWTPNIAAHKRWVSAGGFQIVDAGGPFFQRFGKGFPYPPLTTVRRPAVIWFNLFQRPFGAASHWILATPSER